MYVPGSTDTTTDVVATSGSVFWDDLADDLKDSEFLREFVGESVRIATVDMIVNALDRARTTAGLSKADLARAISVNPAVIRRLFSAERPNPTLGTLAEVAAALGMRVTLEPLPAQERKAVTDPLLQGAVPAAKAKALAHHLTEMRAGNHEERIPA
jgi:transcriptional regulator with XRE-family HTH domain